MDRRQAYETEVLSTFARLGAHSGSRAPEISDEDRDKEYRARRIFCTALTRFKQDIEAASSLTDLRRDALGDLLNALADTAPDMTAWDEAIAAARNGY